MKKYRKKISISLGVLFLGAVLMACKDKNILSLETWVEQTPSEASGILFDMPVAGEASLVKDDYYKNQEIKDTIKVAAVGSPYKEILMKAKEMMEKKGYELEVVMYEDYNSPNEQLLKEQVDANFFQHIAYLERYNIENGTSLSEAAEIFFHPMAIFAGKKNQLSQLAEGDKILVPEDVTGFARSLFLLQQEGILTLLSDADLLAEEADIKENSYGIILEKYKENELWENREEADFIICSMAYVLAAGDQPKELALAVEQENSLAADVMTQILVTKKQETRLEPLLQVLCSEEMKQFVEQYYGGSLQFVGERKGIIEK